MCLLQLPALLNGDPEAEFRPSPFFAEQLTAFELWLAHGSAMKQPPEQLPIVLQACLFPVDITSCSQDCCRPVCRLNVTACPLPCALDFPRSPVLLLPRHTFLWLVFSLSNLGSNETSMVMTGLLGCSS